MEQVAILKKELERELAIQAAQEVAHAARQQEAEARWFKCKKQFQVEWMKNGQDRENYEERQR